MAKPGTTKKPAVVRVRTAERAREILELCETRGWKVVVGVEPDKPEDVTDVERLAGTRLAPSFGKPQMVPLYFMFEEVAQKETRTAHVSGGNSMGLPAGGPDRPRAGLTGGWPPGFRSEEALCLRQRQEIQALLLEPGSRLTPPSRVHYCPD